MESKYKSKYDPPFPRPLFSPPQHSSLQPFPAHTPRAFLPTMHPNPLKYTLFGTCFVGHESRSVIVLIEPLALLLFIAILSAVEVRPHHMLCVFRLTSGFSSLVSRRTWSGSLTTDSAESHPITAAVPATFSSAPPGLSLGRLSLLS